MKEPLNVLVLGVGGNVSQGILKALRLSTLPCRVIGGCVSPLSMGLYTVDQAYISPAAKDPAFVEWMIQTCRTERVDAVLSGVEPVVEVLANHRERLSNGGGPVAIVSKPEILSVCNDKLATCEWLRKNGLNFPRYADAADRAAIRVQVTERGYPLIAKPRAGKGSIGISSLRDERDLEAWIGRPGYVIQENLGDDASEFTVGCFSDRDGKVRGAIAMRRELAQGTTYRAEVGAFPEVRDEAVRIAEKLKPLGPCNVQLRMHKGKATCFEINGRFSGTTALRARFGFNDVEAALRHFVLGEPAVDLPLVTQGVALRYWNEVYVDPKAKDALERAGTLANPMQYPNRLEDYGVKP